jgi:hypothetical protein
MTRFTALLLSLVLATFLAANSANYFFKHPMYEDGDAAAGSLAVDQAKHFAQLYGPYSRWGFYHPGPAFFYVQALGETLLFDTLKVVPAPFNGQVLLCVGVEIGFLVAAIQVFSQWLPARRRWWFFPLAIGLAALHFGDPFPGRPETLPPCLAFQDTWSAHIIVAIFLSLLAASASVAAGRAEELPLLVLAGGCLVHEHVAQPMFVLPCALLAYGGLIAWYASREDAVPSGPVWRQVLAKAGVPWRRQRRSHVAAGVVLAVFLLPLLVDLARGSQSNFAAILHHLRTYHGEHKPWLKSLLYFLQFGAYSSYVFGSEKFGDYDAPTMWRYLQTQSLFLAAWAAAYALAAWALLRQLLAWSKKRPGDNTRRFLAWAAVYLFLATALTLRWGVIQDGEMFYYNAWFDFAIYYFALLIAAAFSMSRVTAWMERHRERKPGLLELGAAILAAVICMGYFGQRLKIVDHTWSRRQAMHDRIAGAIADSAQPDTVKFLNFPALAWPVSAAVALQLDRARAPFVVSSNWGTLFGPAHVQETGLENLERVKFQKWEVVQPADANSPPYAHRKLVPLDAGVDLTVDPPVVVDLHDGGATLLDFRQGASPPDFDVSGWSGAEAWGEWTEGKRAILVFRAGPADADVELTVDAFPFLDPAHGLPAQRLRVVCNGERVGPEFRIARGDEPPIVLTIARAIWNRAQANHGVNVVLELDLPDAVPPSSLDPATALEPRPLGLGIRRMLLRQMTSADRTAAESAAASALPGSYVFNGQPSALAYTRGIGAEGWVGKQATVDLPRDAGSQASFLRLEGVAAAHPGLTFPYRFTTQVDGVEGATGIIPVPGPFEVIVPLPKPAHGSRDSQVSLNFPQTFIPARVEPGSHDDRELSVLLHSLAITRAAEPLLTAFQPGWYERESDPRISWRWAAGDGSVEVAAARAGTLIVKGKVKPLVPADDLLILLDGTPCQTLPMPQADWSPFQMQVPITAGAHVLMFRSRLPGITPPSDVRVIAFGLGDAVFQLK